MQGRNRVKNYFDRNFESGLIGSMWGAFPSYGTSRIYESGTQQHSRERLNLKAGRVDPECYCTLHVLQVYVWLLFSDSPKWRTQRKQLLLSRGGCTKKIQEAGCWLVLEASTHKHYHYLPRDGLQNKKHEMAKCCLLFSLPNKKGR